MDEEQIERHCRICGTAFISRQLVYCSKPCQIEGERRRLRAKERRRRENNPAYWARKMARAQLRKSRKLKARRKIQREALNRSCLRCGQPVIQGRAGRLRVYCSACDPRVRRPPRKPEQKQCITCGKAFLTIYPDALYCSPRCHYNHPDRHARTLHRLQQKRLADPIAYKAKRQTQHEKAKQRRLIDPEWRQQQDLARWVRRGIETPEQTRHHRSKSRERRARQQAVVKALQRMGWVDHDLRIIVDPSAISLTGKKNLGRSLDARPVAFEGGGLCLIRPSYTELRHDPAWRPWFEHQDRNRKQPDRYDQRRTRLILALRARGWIDADDNIVPVVQHPPVVG